MRHARRGTRQKGNALGSLEEVHGALSHTVQVRHLLGSQGTAGRLAPVSVTLRSVALLPPPSRGNREGGAMVKGSARLSLLTVALILVLRDQGKSLRHIVAHRRVRKKDGSKLTQQGAWNVLDTHKLPRQTWKAWNPDGAGAGADVVCRWMSGPEKRGEVPVAIVLCIPLSVAANHTSARVRARAVAGGRHCRRRP